MSNITKTNKMGLLAVFIAASLFVGTFAVIGTDVAFAGKSKGKKQVNEAEQVIAQDNENSASSTCIALVNALSCIDVNAQINANVGSNALAQSNE